MGHDDDAALGLMGVLVWNLAVVRAYCTGNTDVIEVQYLSAMSD